MASERSSIDISSFPAGGGAVVVGETGGLGKAFLDHLQASGAFAAVHAFGRRSDPALELTDESSIAAAASRISDSGHDLRLLIVATGFLHDETDQPEKSLRDLDAAHMAKAFALNAIGPALLVKHFAPLLPRDGKSVLASLSAKVGSIGDNEIGGWYSYRASKAALNQLLRCTAIELARRKKEAICLALHPGTVDTGLSAPFSKSGLDVQSASVAAGRLLQVIDKATPAESGSFLDYKGERLPW